MSYADFHDPFFRVLTSPKFQRTHIADLAAGRCTAIRVPDFVDPAVCEQTLKALEGANFECYGEQRVYPQVMRFGVGVSDHRKDGKVSDSYWDAVRNSQAAWLNLGLPFDPFQMCRDELGANWPNTVSIGRRSGREMASGVAREPNSGFIVHFDDAQREFAGNLLDANLVAQFAFNLYLSVPECGGETVIWRHRWNPADERFRRPGSYGYDEEVVSGAESFELKPAVGEALLFNPRFFHAVRPSQNARRIALGFSLGLSDTGDLLAWG